MIDRYLISETFEYYSKDLEKVFDRIEESLNLCNFIIQYYDETVLIYDTSTDYYLSWYKLTHIGRSHQTNIKDEKSFIEFVKDFLDAIDQLKE